MDKLDGHSRIIVDWGSVFRCVTVEGDIKTCGELTHGTTVRSSARADAVGEVYNGDCIVAFCEFAGCNNWRKEN